MKHLHLARKQEQLGTQFTKDVNACVKFLLSPSDKGVELNGGRNGSKWAPRAILSSFEKLQIPPSLEDAPSPFPFGIFEVWGDKEEEIAQQDFALAQFSSSEKIAEHLKCGKTFIHLGGGHDHIFPLLKAIREQNAQEDLWIINLDAHCDTRTDLVPHSGNPFRQLARMHRGIHLIQIGIHSYANSPSTLSTLENGNTMVLMPFHSYADAPSILTYLQKILPSPLPKNLVFSLDCDVLSSDLMEAVSAPNHEGLHPRDVKALLHWYKKEMQQEKRQQYLGIYEYNPKYDNLSQKGSRTLAALLFHFLLD